MELGIKGKKVLVVGASRGIGRAIALAFAKEGASIIAIARTEETLKTLQQEINGNDGGYCSYYVADVANGSACQLANRMLSECGGFDIVVHNVGGPLGIRDPLAPLSDWQRVWYYNAGIAIDMNSVLIPPMIKQGWGRVIHISSISGIMLRGSAEYATAKAYLNAYTKTLGRAIAKSGVVVSAVMPGAVAFKNSYWDNYLHTDPARCEDFLSHHQAVGRFGTPEEIANFVVLLGSELATFAQGTVIPVDGGNM